MQIYYRKIENMGALNFVEISQMVVEISHLMVLKMAAIRHFGLSTNLNIRTAVRGANMHHHAKFRQNRLNGCEEITMC